MVHGRGAGHICRGVRFHVLAGEHVKALRTAMLPKPSMRRTVLSGLRCVGVGLCLAALPFGASPRSLASTPVERGKIFVQKNCAACHAIGLAGSSPYAPAPPFRTLHRHYDVGDLAEAFAEGVVVHNPSGRKQMPQFVLEPDQIDDLIAYLRSVQTLVRAH